MTDYFVVSTLTANMKYTNWEKGASDLKRRARSVLIQGGSNVANKHLVTPRGVITKVSAEQVEILESNPSFKRHKERGYVKVEKYKAAVEKMVSDMESRDLSAPLTPDDYNAEDAAAPKTNKPDGDDGSSTPAKPVVKKQLSRKTNASK